MGLKMREIGFQRTYIFKIFRGSMPQDPPRKVRLRAQLHFQSHTNTLWKTSGTHLRVTGSTTLTLNYILQFVCGADEEPVLGFSISPQIKFVSSSGCFLPTSTSNTCTNTLRLPSPTSSRSLPSDDILFILYDYAFGSTYFGII